MDVDIIHNGKVISRAKYCNDPISISNGLMFSKKLKKGRSIVLVGGYEGFLNVTVHMLFVFFSLDIVFLDKNKKVVDVRVGRPFISLVYPKKRSKYIIEMNKGENTLKIGDGVEFR